MHRSLVPALLVAVLPLLATATMHCKDFDNSDVDWWIMLKFPTYLGDDGDTKSSGKVMGYIDANNYDKFYIPSDLELNDDGTPLVNTINAINSISEDDKGVAVFNDSVPDDQEYYDYAHSKGFIATTADQGVYIMHSFPSYPRINSDGTISPTVASSQQVYGQYAYCASVDSSAINDIASNLIINRPKIYQGKVASSVDDVVPNLQKLIDSVDSSSSTTANTSSQGKITYSTLAGENLTHVTHGNSLNVDFYEDVLSPYIKVDLQVESWGRPYMDSYCTGKDYVEENILGIKVTDDYSWDSHEDHAKWAISMDSSNPYFCLADNNRMTSQRSRGGGVSCFNNSSLHSTMKSIISDYYNCDDSATPLPEEAGFLF